MAAEDDFSGDKSQLDWVTEFRARYAADPEYTARDFFNKFPQAESSDTIAVELIYEEYCLRRESGQPLDVTNLVHRYPSLRSKIEVVIECDEILAHSDASITFPKPGESFREFELQRELGRGANGRVFLASQPALSDRNVVVKLSPLVGYEHLSLARLQHSAIVPLLFSTEDIERNTRILAMPYLGGCTLRQAMIRMADKPIRDRSGEDIVNAIERCDPNVEQERLPEATNHPAIRFLSHSSYEQAICWIVACLADGLHYAHQRGLAHLDVKPSNILLANDGQPMLLDFHLARELASMANDQVNSIGGTPGYMSPEQRMAMESMRTKGTVGLTIDQKSDIFALGLVMHDLLSGAMPPPVDTQSQSPVRCNTVADTIDSSITPTVAKLLRTCLAEDPDKRPSDAAELANSLRILAVNEPNTTAKVSVSPWLAFLAGCVCSSLLFISYQQNQSKTQVVPPSRVQPDLSIVDELHNVLRRAEEVDIVNAGTIQQKQSLLDSARRLLAHESQLLKHADLESSSEDSRELRSDLQELENLVNQLSNGLQRRSNQAISEEH